MKQWRTPPKEDGGRDFVIGPALSWYEYGPVPAPRREGVPAKPIVRERQDKTNTVMIFQ